MSTNQRSVSTSATATAPNEVACVIDGSKIAAADGEPQAVPGHRIDKSGRVARKEQPVERDFVYVDGKRPEHDGRRGEAGAVKPIAQRLVSRELASQRQLGIPKRFVCGIRWLDEAHVGEATGKGSHADVTIFPHVHLAKRREPADVFEIGANRPAARAWRVAGQPKAERDGRMPSVGRDDETTADCALRARRPDDHSSCQWLVGFVDKHAPDGRRHLDVDAGGDSLLRKRPVQVAANERSPRQTAGIAAFHGDPAFARDEHPFDWKPAGVDPVGQIEATKDRERAGIDGVAAQLVARERCAVDEPHARARARQDRRGDSPRRSSAHDYNVHHRVIG